MLTSRPPKSRTRSTMVLQWLQLRSIRSCCRYVVALRGTVSSCGLNSTTVLCCCYFTSWSRVANRLRRRCFMQSTPMGTGWWTRASSCNALQSSTPPMVNGTLSHAAPLDLVLTSQPEPLVVATAHAILAHPRGTATPDLCRARASAVLARDPHRGAGGSGRVRH